MHPGYFAMIVAAVAYFTTTIVGEETNSAGEVAFVIALMLVGFFGVPAYAKSWSMKNWKEKNAELLDQLPSKMPPEQYAAAIVASLEKTLPPKFTSSLAECIKEWASDPNMLSREQALEMARRPSSFIENLTGVKEDFLVEEMKATVKRFTLQKENMYIKPEEMGAVIDQLFTLLPSSSFLTDDGDKTLRDIYTEDLLKNFYRSILPYDPQKILSGILDIPYGIAIPEEKRFEHTHMLSRSGHGKTTAIEYMVHQDIKRGASVIVIDSQGQMIPKLMALSEIPKEKYCIVDASNVKLPVALNPFSINMDRNHTAADQEQIINTVIELYEWMFSSIMEGSELTGKQGGIFRYVCRLMLRVPNATLADMIEVFEKGPGRYKEYVKELSPTAQRFFTNQFMGKEYTRTKTEILRRLYQLLENDTFARMFIQPDNKIDLVKEMDEGKVILINTSLAILRETGSRVLGRYFISLIQMAAQERTLMRSETPCFVYIDEFQEYIGSNVARLLEQARKSKVGLTLAHQGLYQLTQADVAGAVRTNTATKMIGDIEASDEAVMARLTRIDPAFIRPIGKGKFVTHTAGVGHFEQSFPHPYLEDLPQRSKQELVELIQLMHARYGVTQPSGFVTGSADEDEERSTTL